MVDAAESSGRGGAADLEDIRGVDHHAPLGCPLEETRLVEYPL